MNNKKVIKIIVSVIFIPLIVFFSLGTIALIGKDISNLIIVIVIDVLLILGYKTILERLKEGYQKNKRKENKWIKYLLYTVLAIYTCGISLIVQLIVMQHNKKKAKDNEKILREQELFNRGYKNVCENFYINETEKKIIINSKEYGFSNIKECELIVDKKANIYVYNSMVNSQNCCTGIHINIIIDDFNKPNIKFIIINKCNLMMSSKRYKEKYENANKVLVTLKLIISKNNEKFIEKGTITKIEHRYINEETVEEKIMKLSELYKKGALSEYEYSIRKQELLK